MNKLQYHIMDVDNLKKDVSNDGRKFFHHLYITNINLDQGSRI
jgi:hypothetical protein